MEPTKYRISKITAVGSVNSCPNYEINLDVLYEFLMVTDPEADGVKFVEFGMKKTDTKFKGYSKKLDINRRKNTQTKRFDNQLTVIYKMHNSNPNIKIFKNGNIQITGLKYIDQVDDILPIIVDTLRTIYNTITNNIMLAKFDKENKPITDTPFDINNICAHNQKIVLINSDYTVGFEINRDKLYRILRDSYSMNCRFEPCCYPGVKILYYYNTDNKLGDGICYCSRPCDEGKSSGHGDKCCKKVTISIFQSGNLIITGAQKTEQIDSAYKCINKILYDIVPQIKRTNVLDIPSPSNSTPAKKVMIDASSIVLP